MPKVLSMKQRAKLINARSKLLFSIYKDWEPIVLREEDES